MRYGAALGFLLALAAAPSPLAAEECGVCHPEHRVEFAASLHAAEGVSCVSCHRGDGDSRNPDRAHLGSFRSLTDRRVVAALCAECHSDLAQMRPYNLPVDQYAIYLTSHHGRALAAGDTRAAICSDCHGAHDVRAPDDPASPVYSRNVVATCGRCHGDAALMDRYGLDPRVVDDYRQGIHGRLLLGAGNTAAPDCTDCHGNHGPAPPGVGDIDKVCGSCHEQARRAFLEGPHHKAMLDAGLPECASCHLDHKILTFGLEETEALCADCHDEASNEVALGKKIRLLIDGATAEVERAEEMVEEGRQAALEIEDHLARLEEAKTYLTESLPLAHAVMLEPVEQMTRRARSIGEEIQHEIYEELDRRPAHIGLAVFWFYVLMTLAILMAFKRKLTGSGE